MTLKEYRIQAGMSLVDVSRASRVNERTIRKAENGEAVQAYKISQMINAINAVTGKSLTLHDLEELNPIY
jgi:predicted transcriptional regulator